MLTRVIHLLETYRTWPVLVGLLVAIVAIHQLFGLRNARLMSLTKAELKRLEQESPARYAELSKPELKAGEIFDADFWYWPADVDPRVEAFGDKGRCLYAWTQLSLDLVFPLVWYSFLALLVAAIAGKEFRGSWVLQGLSIAALMGGLADYAENISIAVLCASWPGRLEWLAMLLPYFTKLKFVMIFLPVPLAILVSIGLALIGRHTKRTI